MVIWPSKQIERWKSMISGWLMSWPQIKKIILLKCCLLLFYVTTMNHFLIRLWRATKSGFYMTAGSDQLVFGLSKLFTKPDWHQERSGHCLVVCCSSDPLQLFESWQNHYTWEVCSANRRNAMKTAMPEASTGQQNGPSCTWHNQRFRSWTKWATKVLPHLPYSPRDLLPTKYHFFKHLNNVLQGKCFHNQQEAENAF